MNGSRLTALIYVSFGGPLDSGYVIILREGLLTVGVVIYTTKGDACVCVSVCKI